eukprot:symbB.v1.2.025500.t2/scaffold2452.1/size150514/1
MTILVRVKQLLCLLLALVALSRGQTDAVTPWLDVCTSEDLINYRAQLCPAAFVVSTLAFNPLYPLAESNVTIILQPSEDLQSSIQTTQYVDLNLPGFEALGTTNIANANLRDLPITAGNTVPLGIDPSVGYNTQANPLFTEFAQYNIRTRLLRLMVRTGNAMLANRDTEVVVCCMRLPAASAKDWPGYTIKGPTSLETIVTIPEEPILSTPEIDPGLQWSFLRVSFDPPISQHVTIIHLTLRPANALSARARIILTMPLITRVNNVSGTVNFNTANSLDGADWMFFESAALWNSTTGQLTFFLREGKVLDRQVTLSTEPGEFQLPIELAADSSTLTVSARSFDNIDEVVRETPVTQSSAVPHVRTFTFTRLAYTNNMANQQTNVMFHFMSNRPLFAGSVIYVRLSGFTAQRVEVPLKGTSKAHFRDESAYFRLPENILELHVVRTIYSDEALFQLELVELILPPALYANDTSLLVWNSDPGAPQQPIDDSPEVGNGDKTFKRSQLAFDPSEPRLNRSLFSPASMALPGGYYVKNPDGSLSGPFYEQQPSPVYTPSVMSAPSPLPQAVAAAPLMPATGAYFPKSVQEAWDNHFDAFGKQDVEKILLDYDQSSIAKVYNNVDGSKKEFTGIAGIREMFTELFGDLPDLKTLEAPIVEVDEPGKTVFLIWKCPGCGFNTATDTFVFGPDFKIKRQNIVVTKEGKENGAKEAKAKTKKLAANITFTLEPSIVLYQGDQIVIHMYGFACTATTIPLLGPDAFRVEGMAASWTQSESRLVFTTAQNEIIGNTAPFRVSIGRDVNFRLPDKLSENDGILRIEGKGALINLEPVKKIPKIGDDKYVIESRVVFEPEDTSVNAFTRISFSLVLNTDVLPNSNIYIKLGGLIRDPGRTGLIGVAAAERSGEIKLSGANGPLFRGEVGYWDQDKVLLTVQMISTVQIYAGERVRFFIERDEDFKLPFSAYPNDPSFRLAVPEAGIPERPFLFSSRVSQQGKQFAVSEIFYGSRGAVAYPSTVVEFNFRFQPNVNLPAGTTVRLTMPGFTCPFTSVPIGTQEVPVLNQKDLSDFIRFGQWNQVDNTFDLVVPLGQSIYRTQITVLRIMESGGFRLPTTPLLPNDNSLTIQAIGNVVIFEEPIKTSPRVVDRSFQVSEFIYAPPQKDSIFQLQMILQPTVNITSDNDIEIFLPGFRNSLSKVNIHIMGEDRGRIQNSMGYWNETRAKLTLQVPRREVIPAFTMLDLRIEESQGFILPSALNANDTTIRISSLNNIQEEPIKKSPMVGNGPFTGPLDTSTACTNMKLVLEAQHQFAPRLWIAIHR